MKNCFKCGMQKPIECFYKHRGMSDGHLNKCIDCAKKDELRRRAACADYLREYDRSRANLPHRIEARLAYSQTEQGRSSARKAKLAWAKKNTIKRAAHFVVDAAIERGELVRPSVCPVCRASEVKIHGHHDDYAFPMSVRWLCSKCHSAWHKENGEAKNG